MESVTFNSFISKSLTLYLDDLDYNLFDNYVPVENHCTHP